MGITKRVLRIIKIETILKKVEINVIFFMAFRLPFKKFTIDTIEKRKSFKKKQKESQRIKTSRNAS